MIVFDTNIILLDANNIFGFPGKTIVIPETVVDELDNKKSDHNGELAYQARQFGRILAKAKLISITRPEALTVSEYLTQGTKIQIVSSSQYPNYKDTASNIINDRKIIEIALQYTNIYGADKVTFISNDVMARIRASAEGVVVSEYRVVESIDTVFTKYISVPLQGFEPLDGESITTIDNTYTPDNFNYVFECAESGQKKLGVINNGVIELLSKEEEVELRKQDISPMNVEQLFFTKHLQDPLIPLVICEALSGSGKTAVAISNGIRMVRKGYYDGILYIRSSINDVDPVEEVGFLSGNDEKFAVYLHPLEDTLDFIVRTKAEKSKLKGQMLEEKVAEGIEELRTKCNIQAITTLGMRGRTFTNMYIICDEMQNNSAPQFQKVLTRMGKGCKIVILGSNRQIDNKWVTKHTNGLSILLNSCKSENNYIRVAGVTLHKVVRSPIAEWAEHLFSKQ